MSFYYVGGVNASGKSSLLKELKKNDSNGQWEVVEGSNELFQILGIPVGDYGALNALPHDIKNRAYGEFILKITQESTPKKVIFNSHYLNMVRGVIFKTIEGDWISNLDGILLIETHPQVIYQRIISDPSRIRDIFPENSSENDRLLMLENYILETRREFGRIATKYAIPNLVIDNNASLEEPLCKLIQFDLEVSSASVAS